MPPSAFPAVARIRCIARNSPTRCARSKHLSDEQREALILVGAGGFSYEDAAAICKCAVGTVKSRVARARKTLIEILDGGDSLGDVAGPPGRCRS